jgi:hypothetical protein
MKTKVLDDPTYVSSLEHEISELKVENQFLLSEIEILKSEGKDGDKEWGLEVILFLLTIAFAEFLYIVGTYYK